MRNSILLIAFMLAGWHNVYSQQHISQKELDLLNKNAKEKALLKNDDADFKDSILTNKWENESAVILCQKISFDFDKKEIKVVKKTKQDSLDSLFEASKIDYTLYIDKSQKPDLKAIEERARRTILLKDKCAVDNYSTLYFRLTSKSDAFAARIIKKDGSKQPIALDSAVRTYDIRNIPDIFKSYTDRKFSAIYRPSFYKLAVPGLEEGDIIEYEFVNLNAQQYSNNPEHKEFNTVYYLCNRTVPVEKQIVEVLTTKGKYQVAYKSIQGTPEFTQSKKNGKTIYRWEDNHKDKINDTQYVNDMRELPSMKFQVVYTNSSSKDFAKLSNEMNTKQDVDINEFADKARSFWFNPKSIHSSANYISSLNANIDAAVKNIYKSFKRNGIMQNADEEYVRKAYYAIRSKTVYKNWSDFMFAKVFAGLIEKKKLPYQVVVTASNQKANISKASFAPQLSWVIKFGKNYFPNPGEYGNPNEFSEWISGNSIIHFDGHDEKSSTENDSLPIYDTSANTLLTEINANFDTSKVNIAIDKTTEAKGFIRDAMIDDALAYTSFMETDFKNYDGAEMWQGLNDEEELHAMKNLNAQRKKCREEKPKMMKELAEEDYGFKVARYNFFHIVQDGRLYKKPALKYNETFTLADMTSFEGDDIVVKLPALIGAQTKLNDEDRTRTSPANIGYPCTFKWRIGFHIPKGYKVVTLDDLYTYVDNDYATFESTASVNGDNTLMIEITKVYKTKQIDAQNWNQMLEVLDAAYNFSQVKITLRKK